MYEYFCHVCVAVLNNQCGFDPNGGAWTCTECGHVNGTTGQDIYESQEDYEYQKNITE